MKGINFIITGIIALTLEGIYFLFFIYNELEDISLMFSFDKTHRITIDMWKNYFFHSIGGILILICVILFLIGFYLIRLEQKSIKNRKDQSVQDFINNIK